MRTCNVCGETKPLESFPPSSDGYRKRTCSDCHAPLNRRRAAAHYEAHRDTRLSEFRKRYEDSRVAVFVHYGNQCECCGEDEPLFLTIDHIGDDGHAFRTKPGGSRSHKNIYQWLARNGFPEGFRVLCLNCNQGRYRNGGICPHVTKVQRLSRKGVATKR